MSSEIIYVEESPTEAEYAILPIKKFFELNDKYGPFHYTPARKTKRNLLEIDCNSNSFEGCDDNG